MSRRAPILKFTLYLPAIGNNFVKVSVWGAVCEYALIFDARG